ncbi:MAG: peptidylprolyl isomerase, partial [Parachlamydiaceae bacterium]|nr:peptidylprolyl isomerase [Parachlamydiaceae bacterium]
MKDQESSVKNPIVLFKTTAGDIKVELNAEKAPITVKNFIQYVNDGHYD